MNKKEFLEATRCHEDTLVKSMSYFLGRGNAGQARSGNAFFDFILLRG